MKKNVSLKLELLSVFLLLLFFLGCFNPFAPRLDNSNGPPIVITSQSTTYEVLDNFVYAYTFKDSLVYADILDSSFVFVYFDPNIGSSGRFVSWGRDVDLKTTGQLFKKFDTITLTWNSTIYEDTTFVNDTTIVSIEMSKTLQLGLFGKNEEYTLSGSAVFKFEPCDDGKWRIVRWKDESTM